MTVIRRYTVDICDDCHQLRGQMCNEPECYFCRKTMPEVAQLLEAMLVRVRIDGVWEDVQEGEDVREAQARLRAGWRQEVVNGG